MSFLKKLFSKQRDFVGDFIETGEGLLKLSQSNTIARAELEQFQERVGGIQDQKEIEEESRKSADALSGYGISVKSEAFLETL